MRSLAEESAGTPAEERGGSNIVDNWPSGRCQSSKVLQFYFDPNRRNSLSDNDFQFPAAPAASEPKSAFRAWVRQVHRSLDTRALESISQASCRGVEGILQDVIAPEAGLGVMLYVPIRGEIDTISLASWANQRAARVCVGRGSSRTSLLQPVAIEPDAFPPSGWDRERCEPDAWGMLVPRNHVPVRASSLGAVVVPGLAFDQRGHRLGRGAGVYDRFLASLPPQVVRIGVIPEALVAPELPVEAHDVPMHWVVTERRAIRGAAAGTA